MRRVVKLEVKKVKRLTIWDGGSNVILFQLTCKGFAQKKGHSVLLRTVVYAVMWKCIYVVNYVHVSKLHMTSFILHCFVSCLHVETPNYNRLSKCRVRATNEALEAWWTWRWWGNIAFAVLHLENMTFLDFVWILIINHAYAGHISCSHPSTCMVSGWSSKDSCLFIVTWI